MHTTGTCQICGVMVRVAASYIVRHPSRFPCTDWERGGDCAGTQQPPLEVDTFALDLYLQRVKNAVGYRMQAGEGAEDLREHLLMQRRRLAAAMEG